MISWDTHKTYIIAVILFTLIAVYFLHDYSVRCIIHDEFKKLANKKKKQEKILKQQERFEQSQDHLEQKEQYEQREQQEMDSYIEPAQDDEVNNEKFTNDNILMRDITNNTH